MRTLLSFLFCSIALSFSAAAQTASAANTRLSHSKTAHAPEEKTLQHLYAPYWIAEDGWDTEIQLRNNLVDEPLTVTPILHAFSGEVVPLNSVTIPASELRSVDISATPQVKWILSRYGYLELQYESWNLQNLFAPVMVHMVGQPVMFHIDPRGEAKVSANGNFDGFWWNRHAGLQDVLALTNEGSKPNKTRLMLTDTAGKQVVKVYDLSPQSMVRLSVLDLVKAAGLAGDFGSIHIEPQASGSFQAVHFLYDTKNRFSALMKIFERVPNTDLRKQRGWSRDEGWTLWGPMLALALPDPGLWVSSKIVLKPYIFIENLAPKKTKARVTLFWRSRLSNGKTAPQFFDLEPNAAKKLDVESVFKDLPPEANWATVAILTDSKPDEVIAVAASYDDTGHYGAQTPFSDQLAAHWEGGKWEVDSSHNSMITIGNGGRQATQAQLTFRYQGAQGPTTYVMEQKLDKDQQWFIDLSDLASFRSPDINGNIFAPATGSGTYTLTEVGDHGIGNLFEGKVVTDKRFGDVAYGCMTCCGDNPTGLTPDPYSLSVGFSEYYLAGATNACTRRPENVTGDYYSWWTDDPSIASAQSAQGTGIAPGSTYLDAEGTLLDPGILDSGGGACPTMDDVESAQVAVTPTVTISGASNIPLLQSGTQGSDNIQLTANVTPSGGTFSWSATTGGTNVVLANSTSQTVIVQSHAVGTATIQIQYTVNGQVGTATKTVVVQQPTSLSVTSDISTRPDCVVLPYNGSRRDIQYKVLDGSTPPQPIAAAGIFVAETLNTTSNTCNVSNPAATSGTTTSDGSFPSADTLLLCSASCLPADSNRNPLGSCAVTVSQTWKANGFTVRTNTLNYQCSSIGVTQP
jgi:hypothetical protein